MMLHSSLYSSLLAILLTAGNTQCSKTKELVPPINATSYIQTTPLLKGMSDQPYVRVTLVVPAENPPQNITQIQCSLSAESIANLQELKVYKTASESFSAPILLGSLNSFAEKVSIPVALNLNSGMHFIWIAATLKSTANVGQIVELHTTLFSDGAGNNVIPLQGNYSYKKRIGFAIRKSGDQGVDTYRIPGLIQTDKGTLLSVYDIRYSSSADLPGNIDVGLSRSTDGGQSWEPMKIIMDMGVPHANNGVGDPTILFDPVTKKIFVAALWSKGNRSIAGSLPGISPDTTGQFVLTSSIDDGQTWTAPYTITPQIKNPAWYIFFQGPGNGIAMQDGKLVFPAQYWNENKMPYSTIIYSDDHGEHWKGNILGPKSNTTESQVVETTPGTLMLNMRDNRGGFRSVATTPNMGANWTEHPTSFNALQDPVCMGSLIKAKVNVKGVMKEVLFFCNPNTGSGRYNITVKASLDLGQSWLPANQILIDERNCYGYSCLTQIDENTIGLLYEGVKDIYFVKLHVDEVIH